MMQGLAELSFRLQSECAVGPDYALWSMLPVMSVALVVTGTLLYRAARFVATSGVPVWTGRLVSHGLRGGAFFCYWCLAVSLGAFVAPCVFVMSERYYVGLFYWFGLFASLGLYAHWIVRDARAARREQVVVIVSG